MPLEIDLPSPQADEIVVTGMMRDARAKTTRAHAQHAPVVVWTGDSDLGKTTTARWLTSHLNEMHGEAPNDERTYRAFHYETGEIPDGADHGDKRAIRGMYYQVVGTLDEGMYRRSPAHRLAEIVVRSLRRQKIEMVFVDEAGLLSIKALRGMALLCDVAEQKGWPLTIVLIGMDQLPQKVTSRPQLDSRAKRWVFFEEYDEDATWAFLSELFSEEFVGPEAGGSDRERGVVEVVHELTGGVCGQVVDLMREALLQRDRLDHNLDADLVRQTWLYLRRNREEAMKRSRKWTMDTNRGQEA